MLVYFPTRNSKTTKTNYYFTLYDLKGMFFEIERVWV